MLSRNISSKIYDEYAQNLTSLTVNKQTSELEQDCASLGEQLQNRCICPICRADNVEALGGTGKLLLHVLLKRLMAYEVENRFFRMAEVPVADEELINSSWQYFPMVTKVEEYLMDVDSTMMGYQGAQKVLLNS
ncbi:hypothetical protein NC651_003516 [Populus alba x Populus x berolinensis]|nr:hypothetical protein NC651_003516 [Populus alba x Populus x berolinensis]